MGKKITKIAIFDFDGTLARSPEEKAGREQYEAVKGVPYPHKGWWSKRESLDTDIFDIEMIQSTIDDYFKEVGNENTLVIMMTGRMKNQADQVKAILDSHLLPFDRYEFKKYGRTIEDKTYKIGKLLAEFPEVVQFEMWEDRPEHIVDFKTWFAENQPTIDFKINFVE
jgi:hypothetical protein|tara:strand:- start:1232 stop:1735 length:504 start_codon:yes stop_codon:yes gene_type:complete